MGRESYFMDFYLPSEACVHLKAVARQNNGHEQGSQHDSDAGDLL
jgi:hypothetical protein